MTQETFITHYPDIGVAYENDPPAGGRTLYYIDHDGNRCVRQISTADDAWNELEFLTHRHKIKGQRQFVQPDHIPLRPSTEAAPESLVDSATGEILSIADAH